MIAINVSPPDLTSEGRRQWSGWMDSNRDDMFDALLFQLQRSDGIVQIHVTCNDGSEEIWRALTVDNPGVDMVKSEP